jgi:hypothetical protein
MRQRQADMHRQITSEADDMKRRSAFALRVSWCVWRDVACSLHL